MNATRLALNGLMSNQTKMCADLHVHSWYSGVAAIPGLRGAVRECYAEPRAVYGEARRRGMDLVTLTDHDSIAGALELSGLPGTFVSEEVTCLLPGGRELHLGVFDLDERQHLEIQRRRRDAEALFAYLGEQRLPVAANHLFSALTGRREMQDIDLALQGATLVEGMNGAMSRASNRWASFAGRAWDRPLVGGSDAHTLGGVASAFTVVPGARNREEFLAGLRSGWTLPAGTSGGYARLTAEIARLLAGAAHDNLRGLRTLAAWRRAAFTVGLLVVGGPLLPLVTAAVYVDELFFARRHGRAFLRTLRHPEPETRVSTRRPARAAGCAA